jgi:hypothetical protein
MIAELLPISTRIADALRKLIGGQRDAVLLKS